MMNSTIHKDKIKAFFVPLSHIILHAPRNALCFLWKKIMQLIVLLGINLTAFRLAESLR